MAEKKHCTGCDTEKDLSEFAKNKTSKTGYQNMCKACFKARYKDSGVKKKRARKGIGIEGSSKVEHFDSEALSKQVGFLKERQSSTSAIGLDYSFLDKLI